jgi:hypothetical protein
MQSPHRSILVARTGWRTRLWPENQTTIPALCHPQKGAELNSLMQP